MAARAPDFKPGDMLPGTKYRIVKQIGAGGMGVVYQVVKPPEIQGVLKLMSSDLTEHEEFRTRFLDEVRVLAQIDHPNIVKVFDYDALPDGTPFYVMELLHGRTVRDVLATMGTLPPRVAFEVTRQLCEALHCAHTHDIPVIHRDIKPENIFLHAPKHGEPSVKLIDFGVVAVADRAHDGAFVGTWKYAAPEQIRGERATPATDLYAVGLVLYEMLCGIGPFEHLDSGSLVSQAHLREIPPPVSKFAPWVPPSIVQLISAALAKEPKHRPRDAYAFAERLYELEWANDGKDPNDRTSEGPLSRILSTAGGNGKPSSKNLVAAAPAKDRLGNVPLIGIPAEARHGGPTLKGMGGQTGEATSPGEDALLAGLVARPDLQPRSKKARESGPALDADQVVIRQGSDGALKIDQTPLMPSPLSPGPRVARASRGSGSKPSLDVQTIDAPPSAPKLEAAAEATSDSFSDGTTRKIAGDALAGSRTVDTDTFASQESDARRAPKRAGKLALPIALGLLAVIGAMSFAAYRVHAPVTNGASGPIDPRSSMGATETSGATPAPIPSPTETTIATATATTTTPAVMPKGSATTGASSTATAEAPATTATSKVGAKSRATKSAAPGAAPASSLGSMPATAAPSPVTPMPQTPSTLKDPSFAREL
jgi:serine/threonine-protein kinase